MFIIKLNATTILLYFNFSINIPLKKVTTVEVSGSSHQ